MFAAARRAARSAKGKATPWFSMIGCPKGEAALRVITAGDGAVQPRIVAMIAGLIEEEIGAGRYRPPVEAAPLAYAIVRLAEAFLFNDVVAGMRGDVDRLREVEAALLGVRGPGRGR